ncbi:MAG: cytochrome c [Candidatus Binatia bacterium]
MRVLVALLATAALAAPVAAAAAERVPGGPGPKLFRDKGCFSCHMVGLQGTPIGPELTRIGRRRKAANLERWLHNPSAEDPQAHMPKLDLTDAEIRTLATYLATLR